MAVAANVIFAAYGALVDGDPRIVGAADVTQALQLQFDDPANEGLVSINNQTMGDDPAPGWKKHFGAIVEFPDDRYPGGIRRSPFACEEDQSIDFTYVP